MASKQPSQVLVNKEKRLAYLHHSGTGPGVLFCGGFNSNMRGSKAETLEQYSRQAGWQFTRFDYQGHGESSGAFETGNLTQWLDDALDILDNVCNGPQLIVGSSMGAWLGIHAALRRNELVKGFLGIASAPDFTEELIWQKLDRSTQQDMRAGKPWMRESPYDEGTPYPISFDLIESGKSLLLLEGPIALDCPVRLIHGSEDPDVPWQFSHRLFEKIISSDSTLNLIKNGDHRLSSPKQLSILTDTLKDLHRTASLSNIATDPTKQE